MRTSGEEYSAAVAVSPRPRREGIRGLTMKDMKFMKGRGLATKGTNG